MFVMFQEQHFGQQDARITRDSAPGLYQNFKIATLKMPGQCCRMFRRLWWFFITIANTQPASHIQVLQHNAFFIQEVYQREYTFKRIDKRCYFGEL